MTRTRPALTLLACLAFAAATLLPGCALFTPTRPKAQWIEAEVPAVSDRVLWRVVLLCLDKEGFPLTTDADPTTRTALSGWDMSLAPFKGQGYRERATVKLRPGAPGRYKVEVRVERETNEDIARPMDPRYAKWKAAEDNQRRADVLLQRIRSWIGEELEVGPERRPRLPGVQ